MELLQVALALQAGVIRIYPNVTARNTVGR